MSRLRALQRRPVEFIREFLGVELWDKQQQIARSIVDHPVTAVRSCRGSGKTFLLAAIVLWWIFTRPNSTVVTTAPTQVQVTEMLWKEIRILYGRISHKMGGEMLPKAPKLTIRDGWMAIGISSNDPINYQGWASSGGLLCVIDEASGISSDIFDSLRGTTRAAGDRTCAIGNPNQAEGPFFDLFQRSLAECFHISAFDVPNVVEGREVIPGLATREWVEQMRKHGENTPMWKVHVLGEWPDANDFGIVSLSWFEAAVARGLGLEMTGQPVLGVDVARYGPDSTMIAPRYVEGIAPLMLLPKSDTTQTVAGIISAHRELNSAEIHIDADGLGAGVYDFTKLELGGDIVREIRGGRSPNYEPERFANLRAEMYWATRDALDPSGPNPMCLPDDPSLRAQLTSLRWRKNTRGLTIIESKDDYVRRVKGGSPDEADATVMAIYRCPAAEEFAFV